MRTDARHLAAAAMPGAALALAGLLVAALLHLTLGAAEREALAALLAPRAGFLFLAWATLALCLGVPAHRLYAAWVLRPARLADAAQALLVPGGSHAVTASPDALGHCSAAARSLAGIAERLAGQRDALCADMDARVQEAARDIERERNRLAALMAELSEGVVVCNPDGRILLYNQHAQRRFGTPSPATAAGLIGLGRSIYAALDREALTHGLDRIRQRMRDAAGPGAPPPSAQFVTTTPAGRLLRVQMAPVRDPAPDAGAAPPLAGFVLMLQDITRDLAQHDERDRQLHALTEGTRASLGSLQAAADMLELPDLEAPARERFLRVLIDETRALSARIQSLTAGGAADPVARWPLEEMLGADLVQAALAGIEAAGLRASAAEVDAGLWLHVDSHALLQALVSLAARLSEELDVRRVQLRLRDAGERVHLDLVWRGTALSTETAMNWETRPMTIGGQSPALSVQEVVERHGGAFWLQRDRARGEAFFRFLLPHAAPAEREPPPAGRAGHDVAARPEYYDFDLFRADPGLTALGERSLAELAYTVFDTETTGLAPSDGDEILQLGAARIVNGRLLRHECFEQLVDPGRSIPEAGIAIHGITPAMVAGQPAIGPVLAAFHAFAADTVLVGHNAAFDMRFLQLKEAASGKRFDQPVLDTLLLSAIVSPQEEGHDLARIAERFGLAVSGRHTALGDALLTAEVFLKLLPLLAERGIHTLGQALEASQRTWYARLRY